MDTDDIKFMLGQIDGKLDGLDSHIRAVSSNQKELRKDFNDHQQSVDAHGGKAVHMWIGTGGGIVGAIAAIWAILRGHQ